MCCLEIQNDWAAEFIGEIAFKRAELGVNFKWGWIG